MQIRVGCGGVTQERATQLSTGLAYFVSLFVNLRSLSTDSFFLLFFFSFCPREGNPTLLGRWGWGRMGEMIDTVDGGGQSFPLSMGQVNPDLRPSVFFPKVSQLRMFFFFRVLKPCFKTPK